MNLIFRLKYPACWNAVYFVKLSDIIKQQVMEKIDL